MKSAAWADLIRLASEFMLTLNSTREFILKNTSVLSPPHVPEIKLYLADEAHELWHSTEEELQQAGLPPPFWAFAWAGGQGLARYILDNPELVLGRRVIDFASGSGIVAIAAAMAGAANVIATDIDIFSVEACALNMHLNGVSFEISNQDIIGQTEGYDILLAGDVFYEKALADRLLPWFDQLCQNDIDVIMGDPGRSYLPRECLEELAVYSVEVTRVLEDADVKRTTIWRYI